MMSSVKVQIHPSQFPERVRADLRESLRTRQVNHKFHYDSVKQTMKWLELHQAYSPSRTEADCAATYDRAFDHVVEQIHDKHVHLVGLGCGGGQKDTRLLRGLQTRNHRLCYSPIDVSVAMVLVARQCAREIISPSDCFPLVCDLSQTEDLPSQLENLFPEDSRSNPDCPRLFSFFGMLPNFEPEVILPRLAELLETDDYLLLSANLAPGTGYAAGVDQILPLYDNSLTREWLLMFLLDLGVEKEDGHMRFRVEDQNGLKRIAAYFEFTRAREVQVDTDRFTFPSGESIRLFFSYRHTPALIASLLQRHGLRVLESWITHSEEEGVFLAARST